MNPAGGLETIADQLQALRAESGLHPKLDGKLAEAEINLRGVAGAIEARDAERE